MGGKGAFEELGHNEGLPARDGTEPVAELMPISPARPDIAKLIEEGAVEWAGGKPKGLRGIVVRGEPVSETIVRDRR
jgi:hypothetical protein